MSVRSLFPIVRTADVERMVTFYRSAFGATEVYRWGEDYVALDVGGGHLGVGRDPERAGDRVAIWLYVDDVDAAYTACLAARASEGDSPTDMPWGERVARVCDPDGTDLYLARSAAQPPEPEI